jgi:hypothetical protein
MIDQSEKKPPLSRRETAIVNKAVSGKLKAFYDEMATQEVPDRFKDLLDQLDEAGKKQP